MISTNPTDWTPYLPTIVAVITGIFMVIVAYIGVQPAAKRLSAEIEKLRAERDALLGQNSQSKVKTAEDYLNMAEKVREMAKEVYEERIANLEREWEMDKQKISKLERTIIDQFSIILRLLNLLKESRIIVPADLQNQIVLIYPPAEPSNLFTQPSSLPPVPPPDSDV